MWLFVWLFGSREVVEEYAKRLRVEAVKLRMFGQFNAAYKNYKRAYTLYVKIGDTDAQCNVLCSLAECSLGNERLEFVKKIEAIIASIPDTGEKASALRNLDALKERLRNAK